MIGILKSHPRALGHQQLPVKGSIADGCKLDAAFDWSVDVQIHLVILVV